MGELLTIFHNSMLAFRFTFANCRFRIFVMDSSIAVFDAISSGSYEEREADWQKALKLLHLKVIYIPAIQSILSQGKWRLQPNPVAYIRKAAMWCAVRIGLVDIPDRSGRELRVSDLIYRDSNGEELPHDEKIDYASLDFESKYGSRYNDGDYDDDPIYLVAQNLGGGSGAVDWDQAADLAGLDSGERAVLAIQQEGLGREQALSLCDTDDDRRYLQAAWKRFARHRGALKETLLSGVPHKSRRIKMTAAAREMLLIESESGDLKISFRKLVPE